MSMPPSPSSHPPRECRRVGHSAVATAAANHHPYHHRPAPSSHRSLGLRRFVAAITLMLLVTGGLIVVEAASFWGTTNTLPQLFQFEHFDKPGTVYSASPGRSTTSWIARNYDPSSVLINVSSSSETLVHFLPGTWAAFTIDVPSAGSYQLVAGITHGEPLTFTFQGGNVRQTTTNTATATTTTTATSTRNPTSTTTKTSTVTTTATSTTIRTTSTTTSTRAPTATTTATATARAPTSTITGTATEAAREIITVYAVAQVRGESASGSVIAPWTPSARGYAVVSLDPGATLVNISRAESSSNSTTPIVYADWFYLVRAPTSSLEPAVMPSSIAIPTYDAGLNFSLASSRVVGATRGNATTARGSSANESLMQHDFVPLLDSSKSVLSAVTLRAGDSLNYTFRIQVAANIIFSIDCVQPQAQSTDTFKMNLYLNGVALGAAATLPVPRNVSGNTRQNVHTTKGGLYLTPATYRMRLEHAAGKELSCWDLTLGAASEFNTTTSDADFMVPFNATFTGDLASGRFRSVTTIPFASYVSGADATLLNEGSDLEFYRLRTSVDLSSATSFGDSIRNFSGAALVTNVSAGELLRYDVLCPVTGIYAVTARTVFRGNGVGALPSLSLHRGVPGSATGTPVFTWRTIGAAQPLLSPEGFVALSASATFPTSLYWYAYQAAPSGGELEGDAGLVDFTLTLKYTLPSYSAGGFFSAIARAPGRLYAIQYLDSLQQLLDAPVLTNVSSALLGFANTTTTATTTATATRTATTTATSSSTTTASRTSTTTSATTVRATTATNTATPANASTTRPPATTSSTPRAATGNATGIRMRNDLPAYFMTETPDPLSTFVRVITSPTGNVAAAISPEQQLTFLMFLSQGTVGVTIAYVDRDNFTASITLGMPPASSAANASSSVSSEVAVVLVAVTGENTLTMKQSSRVNLRVPSKGTWPIAVRVPSAVNSDHVDIVALDTYVEGYFGDGPISIPGVVNAHEADYSGTNDATAGNQGDTDLRADNVDTYIDGSTNSKVYVGSLETADVLKYSVSHGQSATVRLDVAVNAVYKGTQGSFYLSLNDGDRRPITLSTADPQNNGVTTAFIATIPFPTGVNTLTLGGFTSLSRLYNITFSYPVASPRPYPSGVATTPPNGIVAAISFDMDGYLIAYGPSDGTTWQPGARAARRGELVESSGESVILRGEGFLRYTFIAAVTGPAFPRVSATSLNSSQPATIFLQLSKIRDESGQLVASSETQSRNQTFFSDGGDFDYFTLVKGCTYTLTIASKLVAIDFVKFPIEALSLPAECYATVSSAEAGACRSEVWHGDTCAELVTDAFPTKISRWNNSFGSCPRPDGAAAVTWLFNAPATVIGPVIGAVITFARGARSSSAVTVRGDGRGSSTWKLPQRFDTISASFEFYASGNVRIQLKESSVVYNELPRFRFFSIDHEGRKLLLDRQGLFLIQSDGRKLAEYLVASDNCSFSATDGFVLGDPDDCQLRLSTCNAGWFGPARCRGGTSSGLRNKVELLYGDNEQAVRIGHAYTFGGSSNVRNVFFYGLTEAYAATMWGLCTSKESTTSMAITRNPSLNSVALAFPQHPYPTPENTGITSPSTMISKLRISSFEALANLYSLPISVTWILPKSDCVSRLDKVVASVNDLFASRSENVIFPGMLLGGNRTLSTTYSSKGDLFSCSRRCNDLESCVAFTAVRYVGSASIACVLSARYFPAVAAPLVTVFGSLSGVRIADSLKRSQTLWRRTPAYVATEFSAAKPLTYSASYGWTATLLLLSEGGQVSLRSADVSIMAVAVPRRNFVKSADFLVVSGPGFLRQCGTAYESFDDHSVSAATTNVSTSCTRPDPADYLTCATTAMPAGPGGFVAVSASASAIAWSRQCNDVMTAMVYSQGAWDTGVEGQVLAGAGFVESQPGMLATTPDPYSLDGQSLFFYPLANSTMDTASLRITGKSVQVLCVFRAVDGFVATAGVIGATNESLCPASTAYSTIGAIAAACDDDPGCLGFTTTRGADPSASNATVFVERPACLLLAGSKVTPVDVGGAQWVFYRKRRAAIRRCKFRVPSTFEDVSFQVAQTDFLTPGNTISLSVNGEQIAKCGGDLPFEDGRANRGSCTSTRVCTQGFVPLVQGDTVTVELSPTVTSLRGACEYAAAALITLRAQRQRSVNDVVPFFRLAGWKSRSIRRVRTSSGTFAVRVRGLTHAAVVTQVADDDRCTGCTSTSGAAISNRFTWSILSSPKSTTIGVAIANASLMRTLVCNTEATSIDPALGFSGCANHQSCVVVNNGSMASGRILELNSLYFSSSATATTTVTTTSTSISAAITTIPGLTNSTTTAPGSNASVASPTAMEYDAYIRVQYRAPTWTGCASLARAVLFYRGDEADVSISRGGVAKPLIASVINASTDVGLSLSDIQRPFREKVHPDATAFDVALSIDDASAVVTSIMAMQKVRGSSSTDVKFRLVSMQRVAAEDMTPDVTGGTVACVVDYFMDQYAGIECHVPVGQKNFIQVAAAQSLFDNSFFVSVTLGSRRQQCGAGRNFKGGQRGRSGQCFLLFDCYVGAVPAGVTTATVTFAASSTLRPVGCPFAALALVTLSTRDLSPVSCPNRGDYACLLDRTCVPYANICDGAEDCSDGSDEELCTNFRLLSTKHVPQCSAVSKYESPGTLKTAPIGTAPITELSLAQCIAWAVSGSSGDDKSIAVEFRENQLCASMYCLNVDRPQDNLALAADATSANSIYLRADSVESIGMCTDDMNCGGRGTVQSALPPCFCACGSAFAGASCESIKDLSTVNDVVFTVRSPRAQFSASDEIFFTEFLQSYIPNAVATVLSSRTVVAAGGASRRQLAPVGAPPAAPAAGSGGSPPAAAPQKTEVFFGAVSGSEQNAAANSAALADDGTGQEYETKLTMTLSSTDGTSSRSKRKVALSSDLRAQMNRELQTRRRVVITDAVAITAFLLQTQLNCPIPAKSTTGKCYYTTPLAAEGSTVFLKSFDVTLHGAQPAVTDNIHLKMDNINLPLSNFAFGSDTSAENQDCVATTTGSGFVPSTLANIPITTDQTRFVVVVDDPLVTAAPRCVRNASEPNMLPVTLGLDYSEGLAEPSNVSKFAVSTKTITSGATIGAIIGLVLVIVMFVFAVFFTLLVFAKGDSRSYGPPIFGSFVITLLVLIMTVLIALITQASEKVTSHMIHIDEYYSVLCGDASENHLPLRVSSVKPDGECHSLQSLGAIEATSFLRVVNARCDVWPPTFDIVVEATAQRCKTSSSVVKITGQTCLVEQSLFGNTSKPVNDLQYIKLHCLSAEEATKRWNVLIQKFAMPLPADQVETVAALSSASSFGHSRAYFAGSARRTASDDTGVRFAVGDAASDRTDFVLYGGVAPSSAGRGVLFNGYETTAQAQGVEASAGAWRYQGVKTTLGVDPRQEKWTVSVWLKASVLTRGFVYAVVDNWVERDTFGSPIIDRIMASLDSGTDISFAGTDWHMYSGIYVNGQTESVKLVVAYAGGIQVLTWEGTAGLDVAKIFDQSWHLVTIAFASFGQRRYAQLFVDGKTSYSGSGWRQCFGPGFQFQPVAQLPKTVNVTLAAEQTVTQEGVAFVGYLNAGVFDLRFFEGFLEQERIIGLGSPPMRANLVVNVDQSLATGSVLAIVAIIFGVISLATLLLEVFKVQIFNRLQKFKRRRDLQAAGMSAEEIAAQEEQTDQPQAAGGVHIAHRSQFNTDDTTMAVVDFVETSVLAVPTDHAATAAPASPQPPAATGARRNSHVGRQEDEKKKMTSAGLKTASTLAEAGATFSQTAGAASTGASSLSVALPCVMNVAQTMSAMFTGWRWPVSFELDIGKFFEVIAFDIHAYVPTIEPLVAAGIQGVVALIVIFAFFYIVVSDGDSYRDAVVRRVVLAIRGGRMSDLPNPTNLDEHVEPNLTVWLDGVVLTDRELRSVLLHELESMTMRLDARQRVLVKSATTAATVAAGDSSASSPSTTSVDSRPSFETKYAFFVKRVEGMARLRLTMTRVGAGGTRVTAQVVNVIGRGVSSPLTETTTTPTTTPTAPDKPGEVKAVDVKPDTSKPAAVDPKAPQADITKPPPPVTVLIQLKLDLVHCPYHPELKVISAPEGLHSSVRADDGSYPYQCACEDYWWARRMMADEDGKVPPCVGCAEVFFVCPDDSCGYCVCPECANLPLFFDGVKATLRAKLYTLRRDGAFGLFGVLIVFLSQLCYLPVVKTALMIIACHPFFQCNFPQCYKSADTSFGVSVAFSIMTVVLLGIGLPIALFYRVRSAKLALMEEEEILKDVSLMPVALLAGMEDRSWRFILSRDTSMLKSVYEHYEFRYMWAYCLTFVLKILTVLPIIFLEPNSLSQLVLCGTVESLQLIFYCVTNPFLNPWIDFLARMSSLHQVVQLCIMCFHRVVIYENPTRPGYGKGMLAVTIIYLLVVAGVLVRVAVVPFILMKLEQKRLKEERTRAAVEEAAAAANEEGELTVSRRRKQQQQRAEAGGAAGTSASPKDDSLSCSNSSSVYA